MSADLLLGLPAKVKKILDRLTEVRAGYLDNLTDLDTAVTTRAPATDTNTLLNRLTTTRAGYLDLIPGMGTFGPITQLADHQTYTSTPSTPVGLPTSGTTVIPVGSGFTELLNLAGPGVIGYLSLSVSLVNPDKTVDFELEIDGVLVYSNSTGTSNVEDIILIGYYTGNYGFVPMNTLYGSNVILRVKHNDSIQAQMYATFFGAQM